MTRRLGAGLGLLIAPVLMLVLAACGAATQAAPVVAAGSGTPAASATPYASPRPDGPRPLPSSCPDFC